MESDYRFIKSRLNDEVNIGIFIVDTKQYKDTVLSEIRSKINFCKKILENKFQVSVEKCMAVAEKVLLKMQKDPKTVREYIDLNQYLQGEELKNDFVEILQFIGIASNIVEK